MRRSSLACLLTAVLAGSAGSACDRCSSPKDSAVDGGNQADASGVKGELRGGYPVDVARSPLATKLCEALHAVPGRRMAECCGGVPSRFFADECSRVLSASIADGAVRLAEKDVEACLRASEKSLEGCDWVTPSQPVPPTSCRGIVVGRLAEGARCRSHLDCTTQLHCGGEGTCVRREPNGSVCGRSVDTLATYTRQNEVEVAHPICAEHCSLVTHKCEPMPISGARCFANVGCATGHLCADGRCIEASAGKLGLPCVGSSCEDGLRCVAKQCVAKAATGEACVSDFDCARGGCAAVGDAGADRACGMTCTHAGDLPLIRALLSAAPTAPTMKDAAAPSARPKSP